MPIINFIKEKKQVEVPEGTNLRKAAMKAGVNLYPGVHKYLNCRGLSQCASCRVLIKKGMENTSSMGMMEGARLKFSMNFIGHEEEMRLACQTTVHGDVEVETQPPMNLFGENFFS